MQSVFRRWISRPLTARTACKLPHWQQHGLRPHRMASIRYKSSVPAMQRLEDDDDYDSDDEFKALKKADWFERSLSLRPSDRRQKFQKKSTGNGIDSVPSAIHNPSFSLDLSIYDEQIEQQEHTPVRLGDMTPEEVDMWLDGYDIPEEAAKLNKSPQDIRQLYAKQLRLEQAVYDLSLEKMNSTTQSVAELQKGSEVGSAKAFINKWVVPVADAIKKVKRDLTDKDAEYSMDINIYGPILFLLDPETLARLVITTALNNVLMEADGVKFVKITLALGKEIQDEIAKKRQHFEKSSRSKHLRHGNGDPKAKYFGKVTQHLRTNARDKAIKYFEEAGSWNKEIQLKLGSALLDLLENNCFEDGESTLGDSLIKERASSHFSEEAPSSFKRQKAFLHETDFKNSRRYGMIRCSPTVYNKIVNGEVFLPWCARYLPMVVPPKPWEGVDNGGYLTLPTKIMRHRDSKWQLQCVARGEMDELIHSLNLLADIPWVINKEVLDVVLQIWKAGGNFADLPPRTDLPAPVEPTIAKYLDIDDEEERTTKFNADMDTYKKTFKKIEKKNREYNSLRCDTIYKLQVAEEFQHEEAIYFPYNMDFRGRVYPIPPNLNHLGSDMSRSLLIFKDKKPLGENGLYWLKVHLAGLYGIDKCSFDDRVKFVDEHMPQILASAANPLGKSDDCRWWQQAEAPFLTLGVVFELARAVNSPNPEEYMSNVPVHMDGSCNGLQHYAALGRDQAGAEQVNLVSADKPQDVYTGVATRVIERMEKDAATEVPSLEDFFEIARDTKYHKWLEHKTESDEYKRKLHAYESIEEGKKGPRMPRSMAMYDEEEFFRREARYLHSEASKNKEFADMLLHTISRKVVKQTVMTSVYGVTAVGARRQIQARLEEIFLLQGRDMDEELEERIYHAAKYASDLTMGSMEDLFASARQIMTWLSTCTQIVAEEGQMMSWITPLGLPVTQPYRLHGTKQVRTTKQHVILTLPDSRDVSVGRQKTAFPPNYVHSLDSTHMMMTSLKVIGEDKLDFAAVHDSYWTHACSVPRMNQRLREEFVALYSQPLLEELREQLTLRFPTCNFPSIPKTGKLDLQEVLKSPYFFN